MIPQILVDRSRDGNNIRIGGMIERQWLTITTNKTRRNNGVRNTHGDAWNCTAIMTMMTVVVIICWMVIW